jgi:hypothetical protein
VCGVCVCVCVVYIYSHMNTHKHTHTHTQVNRRIRRELLRVTGEQQKKVDKSLGHLAGDVAAGRSFAGTHFTCFISTKVLTLLASLVQQYKY